MFLNKISSPVSKMGDSVVDVVEILDNVGLDIQKYTDSVRITSAGAIATFIGTTRDTFEDKEVVELRYEAYLPMAIKQLKGICCAARNQYDLLKIAVAHRLGVVPVGEESVFVAVSSVHRRDALEACEYIIDEIKASVPIWKKEVYANGEVWKENSEFFARRSGEGNKVVGSREHKSRNHSMCCRGKKKVLDESRSDEQSVAIKALDESRSEGQTIMSEADPCHQGESISANGSSKGEETKHV